MNALTRFRTVIFCLSLLLALSMYMSAQAYATDTNVLVSQYGLISLSFLYVTLLITPLTQAFPEIPAKAYIIHARRPLGVAAFIFALLHGGIAFFVELNGFAGLPFLPREYVVSLVESSIALAILLLLAATSFDYLVRQLGKWWKQIHRLIYVAGVLILIHTLALGSHFQSSDSSTYRLWFVLLFILAVFEAARFDRFLSRKVGVHAGAGLVTCLILALGGFTLAGFGAGGAGLASLSVHAAHIAAAQQAQAGLQPLLPGQTGDRSKRFSVEFTHDAASVGQPVVLHIQITNAATGELVTEFTKFYTQFFHILIVDDTLTYFTHVHPDFSNGEFTYNFTPPKSGLYHVYLNFEPYGALEQTFAEELPVGTAINPVDSTVLSDTNSPKTSNGFTFTLTQGATLQAADASVGKAQITYHITKNGNPVSNLSQYLGAFGHLTLVNTDTFEFIHVHPAVTPSSAEQVTGPDVSFLPLGLYGPITPGVYRAFAEFAPENTYTVVPFTIVIR